MSATLAEPAAPVAAPVETIPVVEAMPAPAATEAAPVEAAPAAKVEAEAAEPAEATPAADTREPTLLETLGKEEPKPGETPAEPAKPVEVPTDGLVYEFKAPEGVELIPERVEAYTGVLKEHGIAPDVGQRLLDLHAETIQQYALNTLAEQHKAFNATRAQWRDEWKGDPEIGGSGYMTAAKTIAQARDRGIDEASRPAFDKMLKDTGAGDHPEMARFLYRIGRLLQEPSPPPPNLIPPSNPNPAPRTGVRSLFNRPPGR